MTRSRLLGLGVGAALTVLPASLLAATPASAEDVAVPPTATAFTVAGHGYGHGHGLSQYGAQGAANQGLAWRQIIGFYYPGTSIGKARGDIKVLITAATKKTLLVYAQKGLRLNHVGTRKTYRLDRLRPKAVRWRIVPKAQLAVVSWKGRGGPWHKLVAFPGEAEFTAGNKPLAMRLPGRDVASYRGALRSVDKQTVNVLPMDQYLRGVVPSEVPAEWPAAAVQSQAVAARSYAAFERDTATGDYDICDTTACQVYGGADDEQPGSDQAIRKTRGKIVTYQGAPAFTQFSSSNGGYSSAGSMPYLVAQPDPYEASSTNPYSNWTATLTRAKLEQQWPQVGSITALSITRDGNGDLGGRVTSVTLVGTLGSLKVTGDDFRFLMGLRSDWFALTPTTSREVVSRVVPWVSSPVS